MTNLMPSSEVLETVRRMNALGAKSMPFVFGIDFELKHSFFYALSELPPDISLSIGTLRCGLDTSSDLLPAHQLIPYPETFETYTKRFDIVRSALVHGDSFLVNLTLRTPIQLHLSLQEVYQRTVAPYKLLIPDQFVCFSPERFVHISEGRISTCPMKGTIDAHIPDAATQLLSDYKENCEHSTIVDLMRNDLNRVANHIRIDRFKYLSRISSDRGDILQMSSQISGELDTDWSAHLGDIIVALLPAGSISGAPKARTIEVIREAEIAPRGYYTGVFGYFDGKSLDSAVMIRFIEKTAEGLYFRSGGGITINSCCADEYQECIRKIYLPQGNYDQTLGDNSL